MTTLSLATPNILLVDDNRDGLTVRRILLEEAGFRVRTAGSAAEALDLFTSSRFEIMITDYRMPQMDGTQLIGRIREAHPETRIILLSGFVDPLGLTEESTGADAVIEKSANEVSHLMRCVKRLSERTARRKPPARQPQNRSLRVAANSDKLKA